MAGICNSVGGGVFLTCQEMAPRKTAENTVKHHHGSVGSVVASLRSGGEISVTVTTLTK